MNAHFATLFSLYFITRRLLSFALFAERKGYRRSIKSKAMTKKQFIKHYNCIAEHSKQSISIAKALAQDFLEGGCIIKYGDKLENLSIELLAKLSGISSEDISDLLYDGEVIAVEPGSIVRTYINSPEALYDFYYETNTKIE